MLNFTLDAKATTFLAEATTFLIKATTFLAKATTFLIKATTFLAKATTFLAEATTFLIKATTFLAKATTFLAKAMIKEAKGIILSFSGIFLWGWGNFLDVCYLSKYSKPYIMSELALSLIAETKRTHATALDLGRCSLTELPEELFELEWLENLILSNSWNEFSFEKKQWENFLSENRGNTNQLKSLPARFENLKALKKLIIGGNFNKQWELIDLSPLSGLTGLQTLYVSQTKVGDLSPLSGLTGLQTLNASGTKVGDLSPLSGLTGLQTLNASGTKVGDLSPLSGLTGLQTLNASGTKVGDLSPLSGLTGLQTLYVSQTKVGDLSPLSGLTGLQTLYVSQTKVGDLSPLSGLTGLQTLNASGTQVGDLAPLSGLTGLQTLDVYDTKVGDLSPLSGLTGLQTLNASSTQVGDLSPLSGLTGLQTLDVYDTKVGDLSPLSGLTGLQTLSVFRTQVGDLSPLTGLTGLQTLYVSFTQVSDLTPLSGLSSLKLLSVRGTQVSNLYPISGLFSLETLNIDRTLVVDLDPISGLTALKLLDVNRTQVSDLSPISNLKALKQIVLTDCKKIRDSQLEYLVPLLQKGLKLVGSDQHRDGGIEVKGARLSQNMFAAIETGTDAVLDYLKRKKEPLYEARVLVVGEPRAGKTTLRLKLKDTDAALPTETESTKGIEVDIETLSCPVSSGHGANRKEHKLQYHLWDFGGQEMYKLLHQLFVTEGAAYVIVTNTDVNKNEDELDFWLETIEKLGKSTRGDGDYGPVILFQNAKTDREEFQSFRLLREKFGFWNQKQDFVINLNRIGNKTEEDKKRFDPEALSKFRDFQKQLERALKTLPHIGEEIPVEWAAIRRKLNKLVEQNYISIETYRGVCSKNKIKDEGEQDRLSRMLHILGVVMHYQDNEKLRGLVILNRQWATDALYRVLDAPIVGKNGGWFLREDAKTIWNEPKYRDKSEALLELMQEFKMCYLNPISQRYVVPTKLSYDPPEKMIWDNKGNVRLHLKYDWLPRPVATQLMVSLHEHIAEQQNWIWRRGAVISGTKLNASNALARIQEVHKENRIEINAKGELSEYLIHSILNKWQELHQPYEGKVKVDKIILCNCEKCKDIKSPFHFNYDNVLNAKAQNKPLQCHNSFNELTTSDILRGIFDERMVRKDLRQKFKGQGGKYESMFGDDLDDGNEGFTSHEIMNKLEVIQGEVNHGFKKVEKLNRQQLAHLKKIGAKLEDFKSLQEKIGQLPNATREGLQQELAAIPTPQTAEEKESAGKRLLNWANEKAEDIVIEVSASAYYDLIKLCFGYAFAGVMS